MNRIKAAFYTIIVLSMFIAFGFFLYAHVKSIAYILATVAIVIWSWITYIGFIDYFNKRK